MKVDYMANINENLANYSRKAFLHRDGKAWDNRKAKGYKCNVPRGRVFACLRKQEWQSFTKPVFDIVAKYAHLNI